MPLLRAQRYARYRIIASVESKDDPAFAFLCAAEPEVGAPLEVTVAGLAENAGQKVWNLTAALERLAPEDDVVAFIDADTLPTPEWLPRLVAVLVNSGRPVATGYRWMTPSDDRWSSVLPRRRERLDRRAAARTAATGDSLGRKRRHEESDAECNSTRGLLAGRDQ